MERGEFIRLFKLTDEAIITDETLNDFTQNIKGSYMLFKRLHNEIQKHVFVLPFGGKNYSFKSVISNWNDSDGSFKEWAKGISSNFKIELYMKNGDEWISARNINQTNFIRSIFEKGFNREENTNYIIELFRAAYKKFINLGLYDMTNKFYKSHGVKANHRYNGVKYLCGIGAMNPLSVNSVSFRDSLTVMDGDKRKILNDYQITNAITMGNWWELDECIGKIIKMI